ncbi:uncharacterized protein si:ch211-140l13.3 [Engraulis encrasicolus]|uniref:uncharacterized protein si:ch211-140l13.3 n=1 Tax=Engraulis encrasicolus TaxID=184585 RepID=UPI002FCFE7D0
MSAEINRDSNAPANGCAADACNAQPSSRQRLRPVTSPQPSFSSYRTESISPGMQRPGITHEPANRVPTLSPHSQGPELKSGTVTGDGQLISAGLHAIELTNKREALLQQHVEQLQRVLQEQARLLSLLSPGLAMIQLSSAEGLSSTPALISNTHPGAENVSPSETSVEGLRSQTEEMARCVALTDHSSGKKQELVCSTLSKVLLLANFTILAMVHGRKQREKTSITEVTRKVALRSFVLSPTVFFLRRFTIRDVQNTSTMKGMRICVKNTISLRMSVALSLSRPKLLQQSKFCSMVGVVAVYGDDCEEGNAGSPVQEQHEEHGFTHHLVVAPPLSVQEVVRLHRQTDEQQDVGQHQVEEENVVAVCLPELQLENEEVEHGYISMCTSGQIGSKVQTEQRNLSPIREEPVDEPYQISPFGVRGRRSGNPEDRPIRPAVRESQKTFEDFLEEQLRAGESSPSYQASDNTNMTQKRSFLRKGKGLSCVGKLKVSVPDEECPSRGTVDGGSADPRSLHIDQINNTNALATLDDVQKTATATAATAGCVSHPSDRYTNPKVPQSQACSNQMSDTPRLAKNKKTGDQIQRNIQRNNTATSLQQANASRRVIPRASVGAATFKKVNDDIIQVRQSQRTPTTGTRSGPDSSHPVLRTAASPNPSRPVALSLATELKQCQRMAFTSSETSSSSSSEDELGSLLYRQQQLPPPSSPLPVHLKQQTLELSDGDDATSDAPSDVEACLGPAGQPHTPTLKSFTQSQLLPSTSSEASDSELGDLSWRQHSATPYAVANNSVKTNLRTVPVSQPSTDKELTSAMPVSQLLSSLFPKMDEPLGSSAGRNSQRDKVQQLEGHGCGARAPGQTQRCLNGAIRPEGKHKTLFNELKTTQDEAMHFLRYGSGMYAKSTRGEGGDDMIKMEQLQERLFSLQELLEQREREWSRAHGQLRGHMDSLIRENQELRGRFPFTSAAAASTEVPTHLDQSDKDQQQLYNQRCQPRIPTPAFKMTPEPQNSTSSMRLVSHPTLHSYIKGTKHSRPNTPFDFALHNSGMSSAKSRRPEGAWSQVAHQTRSHVRNGIEVPGVSECSHRKLRGCPDKSCSSRARQTPVTSEEIFSHSDHMVNSNPFTLKDKKVPMKVKEEINYPDGKVEQILSSGCRVITYRDGTRKDVSVDGKTTTITFFNGDVKETLGDDTVVYHYRDAQATHTSFPSGLQVLRFANNQQENHYPDGSREIIFPDGTVKRIFPNGRQESTFPDGTVVKLTETGEKSVDFPNGQRDIHTPRYMRKDNPDVTLRTAYINGRHEKTYLAGNGLDMNHDINGTKIKH